MENDRPPHRRRARPRPRGLYVLWIGAVICAGLASRSRALNLPPFIAKYAGDALWALMVFVGLGFLLPRRTTATLMVFAAVICVAVEFSQLYHAPWIDAIRRTTLGHLALGDTFAWPDIVAYLIGVAIGGAIELAVSIARPTPAEP
jgi:hypothetical protein